jgi:hypothetical protein
MIIGESVLNLCVDLIIIIPLYSLRCPLLFFLLKMWADKNVVAIVSSSQKELYGQKIAVIIVGFAKLSTFLMRDSSS